MASRLGESLSLETLVNGGSAFLVDRLKASHEHSMLASELEVDSEIFLIGCVVCPGHQAPKIDSVADKSDSAKLKVRLLRFDSSDEWCKWRRRQLVCVLIDLEAKLRIRRRLDRTTSRFDLRNSVWLAPSCRLSRALMETLGSSRSSASLIEWRRVCQ